jgi:hypothetical protein
VELLEEHFGESSTDVTDGLICITVGIVGSKEESTIDGSSFSTAVVGTEDNEIERVADTSQVILFDLCRS